MRLILPQGVVDFDTLGAMLGAFLLDADTIVLTPEQYTKECGTLAAQYAHKFPFVAKKNWFHPDKKTWKLPLWDRMALGMDFLQSLQVAKWLKIKNVRLDPFYASVILLGIYASTNTLDSFSIDDEVHGVIDYLVGNGANEKFVQDWLSRQPELEFSMPSLEMKPLSIKVQQRIPAWQKVIQDIIYEHAWELGMKVYLVGGVVRDLVLDRPSRDMDFIVEGSAILLAKTLEKKYGGRLVIHTPFKTARWDLIEAVEKISTANPDLTEEDKKKLPASIDLISARTEWYPAEGQLPQVRLDGIELDMQRRDFSVNTLALRIDGEGYTLLDACNGFHDLEEKTIRALHQRSFIDDPTRLFRAVRYEQRLDFTIEPQTKQWMTYGLETLPVVSGDRIRHELNLMMGEENPWNHFKRSEGLGILNAIHPAWGSLKEERYTILHAVLCESFPEGWVLNHGLDHLTSRQLMGYAVLLQDLSAEDLQEIGKRLLFSAEQVKQLRLFIVCLSAKDTLKNVQDSEFTFYLEKLHPAILYVLLMLWLDDQFLREKIINMQSHWRKVVPIINGNDLVAMRIPRGPVYGKLLKSVRAARIDGLVRTKENEIAWVRKMMSKWGIN